MLHKKCRKRGIEKSPPLSKCKILLIVCVSVYLSLLFVVCFLPSRYTCLPLSFLPFFSSFKSKQSIPFPFPFPFQHPISILPYTSKVSKSFPAFLMRLIPFENIVVCACASSQVNLHSTVYKKEKEKEEKSGKGEERGEKKERGAGNGWFVGRAFPISRCRLADY
ncbi:hypothetical protein F5B22DRAFT_292964 [Xylaria bambusicola]|uniref:uncharacterized protein n=1 Tax=Xylaria bambusicola TaxID=326684 RepID=UPI0020074187|nr:uncharacterized protein F5B22DRAFT_292964 [Xylaria bambusicola]KAI0512778.1 hypothetical protein F5B22DRAFT_292964 [Xylaria bambusicola]